MPDVAWLVGTETWSVDRCLMQSLARLSSNEAVRGAAAAWLAAFDAARAAGASEDDALAIASRGPPVWGVVSPALACESVAGP
jgi:hypothetical protein